MADDTTTVIIVVLVFVMIVVTWLELRYLRRKSKSSRQSVSKRPEEIQDQAHNALITTRAIVSSLSERSGIRSDEVDALVREAQMAYNRRNYRVAIDLTTSTRERLAALKSEPVSQGDLLNMVSAPPDAAEEEPTTKELLQKEYPPNLIQSKFAISLAESTIVQGESAGRDVVQAQALVVSAKARFEAQDYSGALSMALQAERRARGEPVPVSTPPGPSPSAPPTSTIPSSPSTPAPAAVAVGSACPSCGAPRKPEDTFCRKCGTRVVLTNCPTCRTSLLPDDAFCRRCGARIQR